jgi:hypothetical protein
LVEKGLAVVRAVHDRYDARERNPFNEIECSDHYARAMASYAVFVAACGFTYHGPRGEIGLRPENPSGAIPSGVHLRGGIRRDRAGAGIVVPSERDRREARRTCGPYGAT